MQKRLQMLSSGRVIHTFSLDDGSARIASEILGIQETRWCGFRLLDRDPKKEYSICIGDNIEEALLGEQDSFSARSKGDSIVWEDRQYYESGVGAVFTTLFVRAAGTDERWEQLFQFQVEVHPDKIGTRALYERLLEDVQAVAASLIFDFVSKNSRSVGFKGAHIMAEPSIVHLRKIESVWNRLTAALSQIRLAPATVLARTRVLLRPNETDSRSLDGYIRRGISPWGSTETVFGLQLRETHNIYEHRLIKGFIVLLINRVETSKRDAVARLRQLEENKPKWLLDEMLAAIIAREHTPRVVQLASILERCNALSKSMRQVLEDKLYRSCAVAEEIRSTGIFSNISSYNAVFRELVRYRNTSLWSLETGLQEKIKLTSRLYEHWLFIQIAAAFRDLGFECLEANGLFVLVPGNAFQLDLDRGTTIRFRRTNSQIVRLRYEPWIPPQKEAHQDKGDVYTSRRGPLNPDVVIEFGSLDRRTALLAVDYVVVVDAKYSKVIPQETVDKVVGKYRSIGAGSRRRVVKQIWLAHPSEKSARPEDEGIVWGQVYGPHEEVEGIVGLSPHEKPGVAPSVLRFVRETLTFKGEDLPEGKQQKDSLRRALS
jgi:hypothetical protein